MLPSGSLRILNPGGERELGAGTGEEGEGPEVLNWLVILREAGILLAGPGGCSDLISSSPGMIL